MDKEMYKQLVAEYMRREAKLKSQVLMLEMELADLKDEYHDMGGDTEKLPIYESPDGGETVYVRQSGSDEKTFITTIKIKSPEDDTNQLNLFND